MKMLAILLLIAQALPCRAAEPALSADEIAKQRGIYSSRGDNRPEGYIIGRSLLSYSGALAPGFMPALALLGPESRWLDIGAGEGQAILDYRTSRYDVMLPGPHAYGTKARAVAISIEDRRTPEWHRVAAALGPQEIDYRFGKPLREYMLEELGRFNLISDVFGGFSYTRTLSTFLEKALALLEVNGSFFTVLQDVRWNDAENRPFYAPAPFLTELANVDGSELKMCAWLKAVSCVDVTCEAKDASPPVEMYRIRKTCENVTVPALAPVYFRAGTPPERKFSMTSAAPSAARGADTPAVTPATR